MKKLLIVLLLVCSVAKAQDTEQPDLTGMSYASFREFYRSKGKGLDTLYAQLAAAKKIDNAAGVSRASMAIDDINKQRHSTAVDYIRSNPDSAGSIKALSIQVIGIDLLDDKINKLANELYEGLSANLRNSPNGKDLGVRLSKSKRVMLGALAPELISETTDGKQFKLSDYRGKYVLLDFWASWCGPCRQEFPYLKAVYEKYKNKNFEIVGVSVDHVKSDWLKAIQKDQVNWVHVSRLSAYDDDHVRQYLLQTSVPQNWLINPEGKIIAYNLRGADLEKKIAELF